MAVRRPGGMERVARVLWRWSSPRRALLFLVLWFISAALLQVSDQRLATLSDGQQKLDLRFGYDFETVDELFEAYGAEGRAVYTGNLGIDTIMPLLLALATWQFVGLAFRRPLLVTLLAAVPLLFFLGDVVENGLLLSLVTGYPVLEPGRVRLASAVTQPKLALAMGSYAVLAISAIVLLVRVGQRQWGGAG